MVPSQPPHPSAQEILTRLLEGNARYADGRSRYQHHDPETWQILVEGQTPLATVIGCSDSRVPPELVFDAACGDLFVIRTAGHVLGSWTLASLEYALVYLRTPLVAVLAHSRCGAVTAAVRGVDGGEHLPDLVARIAHAIPTQPVDDPVHATTLEHLRREVTYLRHEDPVVAPRHASGEVMVVGLHKDLATRRVNVVVGPQDPARPLSV